MISYQKVFHCSSANRSSGTNEDFTLELDLPNNKKYDRVFIQKASVPISYYAVDNFTGTTFQLKEGSTTVTITLEEANYNINSFCLVVSNLLTTHSPNGWSYTITYPNDFTDASTAKLTFSVTGNSSQPSIIVFNELYRAFGFDPNTTNTFVGNQLVSQNVCYFVPNAVLYLLSDCVVSDESNDHNILVSLYGTSNLPFTSIVYDCQDVESNSKVFNKNGTTLFHFSLVDGEFNPIDLNGIPFYFTICFYKKEDYPERMKKFIRLLLLSDKLKNIADEDDDQTQLEENIDE